KSAAWQQATSSSGNSSGKSGVQELPAGDSGATTVPRAAEHVALLTRLGMFITQQTTKTGDGDGYPSRDRNHGSSGTDSRDDDDTDEQGAPAVVIQDGTGDLTPEWEWVERRQRGSRHELLMMKLAMLEAHFSRYED
ncbi:MAG: hypothetical protein Q9180_005623, partial [Flavoplaca navasiana]